MLFYAVSTVFFRSPCQYLRLSVFSNLKSSEPQILFLPGFVPLPACQSIE